MGLAATLAAGAGLAWTTGVLALALYRVAQWPEDRTAEDVETGGIS